jgi:hypothetical protein
VNRSRPLKREMLEELQKEQPSALIELVMRMQEALDEMRQEVGRLQRRVAELEVQNRPPSAPFRRAEPAGRYLITLMKRSRCGFGPVRIAAGPWRMWSP